MSIFYFRTLLLGSNSETIHFYMSRAFGEPGEDKDTYVSWYKEVKVLDNKCDLEIDALISISADLDEIIPMVDGIIYFINPMNPEESELFEMILPDIFSVKRDIPTIIVFYDQDGILPISVNDLLTQIWVNFPSLEAYVNLSPSEFHQALQSLCLAMIDGDAPLNIENAWMRFPIFIQMANIYFNNRNYFYAAQAIRKAAQIADIYNKEEFFIISEQAAYLYSKMNLYLEASEILEKVDKRKSTNFKKLYAEAIIREGNLFFKRNEYERAARSYERAAQWSSIELLDRKLIHETFRLAINSWISACRVEEAFRILQSLPHKGVLIILREVSDKICGSADYLVSINNFESAKEQLYIAVRRYQREDLFDELKDLASKLTDVLIILLKQQVNEKQKHAAKYTYDEIENMWGSSYNIKKTNMDPSLENLITLFLEDNNFETASVLINKLYSRKLKEKLAKIRDDFEEKYKHVKKKEVEDYINKGIDIIRDFAEEEQEIIIKMNSQKITEANELAKQKSYVSGANLLIKQAEYLRCIGKDEIRDQILTKSLDILLNGLKFENFFINFDELSGDIKTKYLIRIFPKYIQNLHELRNLEDYERIDKIFDNSNKIYRNQMLYDQSKEISLLFIKVIKKEAFNILEREENLSAVNKAELLIKKVLSIASAYLEKEENIKLTFNKIYKKIAEIYIEADNLHLAHVYNDKIEKPGYKIELHKKIEQLEAEKSEIRSKKAKETRKGEELKEKDSIIEKRAQEARLDKENDLRERKGLKRGYFKDGLSYLANQQYDKAIEEYKTTINRLNLTKKYKMAGLSLTIAILILMKQNKFKNARTLLDEIKRKLTGLGKPFFEAFPVTLIEYVIDLKSFRDEEKFKKSLDYFKILPLFEEELILLHDVIGEEYQEKEQRERTVEMFAKKKELKRKIKKLGNAIQRETHHIKQRNAIKNQYWRLILEDISNNKMINASIGYFDTIPKLIKEGYERFAAVGLIVGSVILINEKNLKIAQETFEKYLGENNTGLDPLPEIQILKNLFPAIRNDERSIIKIIIDIFIEKLVLFDPEIQLLIPLKGEEITEEQEIKEMLSREEFGDFSKFKVEIDQRFGKIQAKALDAKRDKDRILKKRKAMRKRYYSPIIELLESKKFKAAAEEYLKLAYDFSKRKDLETSSLMILLHGLALLKEGKPIKSIKSNISENLNSLGVNKKLVEETFCIMLIMFLLDVKLYNFDVFLPKIKEMLRILPLFEEEKILIDFN